MDTKFQFEYLPYSQTGRFSKIVVDYVNSADALKDFYTHPVDIDGIKTAIVERKKFDTNRKVLVEEFSKQYEGIEVSEKLKANINALLDENTFTICTAHQPNIFTGHLYFIYKIFHTIKVADLLNKELEGQRFVPVFFMGSEDADLQELNHVVIGGEKYTWETKQTGAVGRMKVDDDLLKLIERIAGRLSVEKYGSELIELLKKCFIKNSTIENSTFLFVHYLFKDYGLLVLLPDNSAYKNQMKEIFEDDIFNHTSSEIVNTSSSKLAENYKAQAYPREINLFYLKDNIRNRIVALGDHFVVHDTDIVLSKEEMKKQLKEHPELFSPNVILRGLFQEMILPDVAWIGGGGELAYWLQLKDLFNHYRVPFPLLITRNSFLLVDEKSQRLLEKLNLDAKALFRGKGNVLNDLVKNESNNVLTLQKQIKGFQSGYEEIKTIVGNIDPTLKEHTSALETKQMKKLSALEKKMLRAEKRKFAEQKNQLEKLYALLFPSGELQERVENFMLFYARFGEEFFHAVYETSLCFEQEFCIIRLEKE
ncbi:MAG: bacillithiol biosynthesis cysteine-adding enzyme BshC [Ginsengibacter sp.]